MDRTLETLEADVAADSTNPLRWLQLAQAQDRQGLEVEALQSRFRAVTQAQLQGQWLSEASTPREHLDAVVHAFEQVRTRRREVYLGSYHALRREHGAAALQRVDRALLNYLGDLNLKPSPPEQRPRFLYFPDLPSLPFLDPFDQPWAPRLQAAFPEIRREALEIYRENVALDAFIRIRPGDRKENYLGGTNPSWEGFYFYRHGKRYDENHARCPATSQVLESIELCRITDHAPEICFSFGHPGTHLLRHFGVTNVRSVMHLPLLIPEDCALHVFGAGTRTWREGELLMFDDTYEHEAWNRSKSMRIILLMDCWNPGVTAVERVALSQLIKTIATLHRSARAAERTQA